MKYSFLILAATLVVSSCKDKNAVQSGVLTNEIDSVSYALGVNIGESLKSQGAGDLNFEIMMDACNKAYNGDTNLVLEGDGAVAYLNTFFQKKQQEKAEKTLQEGKDYLAANGKKSGVVTTASGLQYEVLKSGSGAPAKLGDKVSFHYVGSFINGEEFENSTKRGQPAEFTVGGQVMPGLNEAIQLMKEGDKWKLTIPSELAYGSMAGGRIPANSTIIFEVELLQVSPADTK
jgi:FKBP-type peptidyl-prolyl cis-trans isomerase